VVIIAVGGNSPRFPVVLRHMIWHPREDDVTSGADLTAMKVTDADATETLVSFHQ
ncbi:MAG: hypothetical protein QOI52_611, partial [Chloroflexota bacterium]|nr:hypothetical protein [Chloroflexota bacterium]